MNNPYGLHATVYVNIYLILQLKDSNIYTSQWIPQYQSAHMNTEK